MVSEIEDCSNEAVSAFSLVFGLSELEVLEYNKYGYYDYRKDNEKHMLHPPRSIFYIQEDTYATPRGL
jgi:hypothetical protein